MGLPACHVMPLSTSVENICQRITGGLLFNNSHAYRQGGEITVKAAGPVPCTAQQDAQSRHTQPPVELGTSLPIRSQRVNRHPKVWLGTLVHYRPEGCQSTTPNMRGVL